MNFYVQCSFRYKSCHSSLVENCNIVNYLLFRVRNLHALCFNYYNSNYCYLSFIFQVWKMLLRFFYSQRLMFIKRKVNRSRWTDKLIALGCTITCSPLGAYIRTALKALGHSNFKSSPLYINHLGVSVLVCQVFLLSHTWIAVFDCML